MTWVLLYAALTLGCCMIVLEAYRGNPVRLSDIRVATVILAATFVASNLIHTFYADRAVPYVVMDALCGAFFLLVWRQSFHAWALALFSIFAFECAHHAAFAASADRSFSYRYGYALTLNMSYVAQLCVVTAPAFVAIVQRRRGNATP